MPLNPANYSGNYTIMRMVGRKMPPPCSQPWIDLVDLAMHRAIVRKIRRTPKLYRRAVRNLTRWQRAKRGCPPPLREWKELLTNNDMDSVLRILIRPDEEGNRLRSTAPF